MTETERNLVAVAYHEAGHAVVAWAEGVRLHSATIVPSEGTMGSVTHGNCLRGCKIDYAATDTNRLKAER